LLRRYKAGFCIFEMAGFQSPIEVTSDYAYVRLHGPRQTAYQGEYATAQLWSWAERIGQWQGQLQQGSRRKMHCN
jgi:uncharacterized protein YecE (DUF72 family)